MASMSDMEALLADDATGESDFGGMDDIASLVDDATEVVTDRRLPNTLKFMRRVSRRRFVNGLKKQALNKLMPELPPTGTDVYIVSNGSGAEKKWMVGGVDPEVFDFGTFIPHLVDLLGGKGCIGWVSTWTMNRNHAMTMTEMLADGRFQKLTVFTDPYFQRRTPAVAAVLMEGLRRFPQRGRYLAFKNHVKLLCIANADETRTAVISGSANLSAQPRCEQYVLTTAPDVYEFYKREFFEAMLNG